jgi:prepilin-type N-terminal cleavage/methylation domain-containing protein
MRPVVGPKDGFSLIELIMVIITVGIISVVVAPVFMSGFNAFFWARDLASVSSQGELAMERMTREIRSAQPSGITAPLSASQLTINVSGAAVTYLRNAQNRIMRNSDLLASSVSSLAFAYYKEDWSAAALPAEVWSIRITMTISGRQASESLGSTVFLRSGLKVR